MLEHCIQPGVCFPRGLPVQREAANGFGYIVQIVAIIGQSSGVFDSMHGCEWLHRQHSMNCRRIAQLCIGLRSPQIQTETQDRPSPHFLHLLYVRGVSERIEQVCRPLEIRTTFKSRRTLREALVQTKEPQPVWKKRGVVYQIPCAEC